MGYIENCHTVSWTATCLGFRAHGFGDVRGSLGHPAASFKVLSPPGLR